VANNIIILAIQIVAFSRIVTYSAELGNIFDFVIDYTISENFFVRNISKILCCPYCLVFWISVLFSIVCNFVSIDLILIYTNKANMIFIAWILNLLWKKLL
jgi:hypothetical protein